MLDYKLTFGECLKSLLSIFNISMNQLAKAINVDNSLVSRWVNEKRIPPRGSTYVEKIVEYLCKNEINIKRTSLIDELYQKLNFDTKMNTEAEEKIRFLLYSTLDYSFRNKPKSSHKNLISSDIQVDMGNIEKGITNLSRHDKLIHGRDNIYTIFTQLLKTAIYQKPMKNDTIYLTFSNMLDPFFFTSDKVNHFSALLLEAIEAGWKIVFLIKLVTFIDQIVHLIRYTIPLLSTEKLKIYYINNHESYIDIKDLYIVPNIGVISGFPSDLTSGINIGFFITNKPAISVFGNYAKQVVQLYAKCLVTHYQSMDSIFLKEVLEITNKNGNIFTYHSFVHNLLLPINIYKKLINQTDLTNQEKALSIQYYENSMNIFYKNLRYYVYQDICVASVIESALQDQILYIDTYVGVRKVKIEANDLIDYLNYFGELINQNDNYQVAIMYRDYNKFMNNVNFVIKERLAVFFYHYDHVTDARVCLSIHEPILTKAFKEYYISLWNKISPIYKDKADIIHWLQKFICIIRSENS